METAKGKTSEIKFLDSIIQENTSLRGRVAILTYQNLTHSTFADRVIIFWEHYQSIIVFMFTNYTVFKHRSDVAANVIDVVFPIIYASSPGSFTSLTKKGTMGAVILCWISFALFVFKMAIFASILKAALRKRLPSKNVHIIWQWIFKLQPRIIYYIMAPILTAVAEGTIRGLFDLSQGMNDFLKFLSSILFAGEFIFALILQTQFTCTLPTKNFLSSKNNTTQILTLLQKFINHMVRKILIVAFPATVVVWPANLIIILLSFVRLGLYFYDLPAYDIDCLFYQMYFLMVVLAHNVACTLQLLVGEETIDMNIVIGIWFILSIFFLKISINYLRNRLCNMVLKNNEKTPEALIHKLIAAKYFLKRGGIPEDSDSLNYDWISLVQSSLIANPRRAFAIIPAEKLASENWDLRNKDSRNKLFSMYLEELLIQNPKSDFIRLYAAYYFAHKQRCIGKCFRTIHELKKSNSWNIDISISVLFHNIKERIIYESQNKTFIFDISEFAKNTASFAHAKLKVLEQTELQVSLYQEMKEAFPLVTKLNTLGEKIAKVKREVEVFRREFLQDIPEYFLEPLLFYAHYDLVLNHSYERFSDYYKIYYQRAEKYGRNFKGANFCQENFYKKNTGFLILSGEKQIQGKILHCGGNYEDYFGRNLTGSYIGTAVPPLTMTDPKTFLNRLLEAQEKTVLNTLATKFFYNHSGYMTETECYMNLNPYLYQGLTYYMIFRSAKTSRETILINREGQIECFTYGIGQQLGLFSLKDKSSFEDKFIGKICPELQLANDAFNCIENKGKSNLTLEEAKEICSNYQEGQVVQLEKINHNPNAFFTSSYKFSYRCTINPLKNNSFGAKEIYLEHMMENENFEERPETFDEIKGLNDNDDDSIIDNNEKEAGWIDFGKLQTNSGTLFESNIQSPPTTTRGLLISRLTTQRALLTAAKTESPEMIGLGESPEIINLGNKLPNSESFSNALSRNESVFSLKSEFLGRNKIKKQKIFEQAIKNSYISTRYKLLILLLFGILAFVFGLQINLTLQIRQGFNDFSLNKEIVLTAESRNYYVATLNTVLGVYYGKATGIFEVNEVLPGMTVSSFKTTLDSTLNSLRTINADLLNIANSLSDLEGKIFFSKDVRLYDIYYDDDNTTFTKFTNFQATNQIIESALRAGTIITKDLSGAIPYLKFGLRNIMNDILIKGNTIADNFYTYLQESKEDFLQSLTLTFVWILIVPVLGLIVICFLIFMQYKTDWTNLLAFTKINKNAVEAALNNSSGFRNFLQQNKPFDNLLKDENVLKLLKNNAEFNRATKNQLLDNTQAPNSRGFARKYFLLAFKVFLMLALVTVSFSVYFFTFRTNLTTMGDKAYQLYFLERVASRLNLIRTGFFEMVILNNTMPLENNISNEVLLSQISELQEIQHEFPDIFSSVNSGTVDEILFNDACEHLEDQVYIYNSCQKLGKYQNKPSWINLISNMRDLFEVYLNKYEISDKTETDLRNLAIDSAANLILPISSVVKAVNDILATTIDGEFIQINSDSTSFNGTMIAIYIIIVVIAGFIGIWGVIFPLRSKENKFKQFLLLFPANTILSNFMLKSFLMKISKGTFDSIMQEI